MVFRTASHRVSSRQTRDFECFADDSNIPWNAPTIHCPDLIATIPQMSLLSLCALLSLQSHLFPICVITFGFLVGSSNFCKLFLVSWEVSVLHGSDCNHCVAKSCTTKANRWLLRDSLSSLRILWSAVIKITKMSALGTTVPVRLLQQALVIFVFKQISQFGSFGKCV